jgi:cytochrome c551/c552
MPALHSRLIAACLAVSGFAVYGAAHAQRAEPTVLVDQQHCMFCHTSDAPFLAPAFHQIAERYRDNPDAIRMLEQKLRAGGRAHWGDMPMPVSAERGGPPLSPEDAHTLIEWVMSQ